MILFYLLIVNVLGAIIFMSDKYLAKKDRRRVPEKRLHLLEFLGAALSIVPLMYLIRHKNRKSSYYVYTWIALIVWLSLLYFYYTNQIF